MDERQAECGRRIGAGDRHGLTVDLHSAGIRLLEPG